MTGEAMTYRVTIRREVFRGRDSFVARDTAGEWRAHGVAINSPMTPRQLAEYLFRPEEVAAVSVDADGGIVVDVFAS